MSREKECKCCHEWWYASVIKEDLCPNCYDYFKQLKQELDQQKAMWNKLKEWLSFTQPKHINDEFLSGACAAYSNVVDKMQELEKGEKE